MVVDWDDVERPVEPPAGQVLGMAAVRDLIAGMGLDLVDTHEPGELLTRHIAVVAGRS